METPMNNLAQNALHKYQATDNSSLDYDDPHELILRLMSGALERVAQAKGAMQQNNVSVKGELISKAIAIISGLNACLDHEQGGEISTNLAALYEYMNGCLLEANLKNNLSKLDEVSGLMQEIMSAWVQIPKYANSEAGQK
jgi:flagellar protein FliS